ncbi:sarcoplasmic calcium-binding protein 1 [Aricia agestis]|uniref:sarcoplasmic calcium-binding protein 1 n=1 Tax=Aricia agestis TaxID=91739 RepID=UPI001C207F1D|nr:sarcoplasmic calcium-binding protein 1 [Aricia agestis]
MAYTWDNRVSFVVRFLYDIDNNGQLDSHDFKCLALRSCVLEGKGDCSPARLQKFQHIMTSLWEELSELADFNKDGMITTDEFKKAVQDTCVGKKFEEFPQAMKAFIEINFKLLDINDDGIVGLEEFRYDCVSRMVVEEIKDIDDAFNALLNDEDRKVGGINLARYRELFAQFLSDTSDSCPAQYLFGPLVFN